MPFYPCTHINVQVCFLNTHRLKTSSPVPDVKSAPPLPVPSLQHALPPSLSSSYCWGGVCATCFLVMAQSCCILLLVLFMMFLILSYLLFFGLLLIFLIVTCLNCSVAFHSSHVFLFSVFFCLLPSFVCISSSLCLPLPPSLSLPVTVVSTLQYKVSNPPVHPDTPPEYRQFRANTLPPSYVRVASSSSPPSSMSPSQEKEVGAAREKAQLSSQLSTSLASAFSPVQAGVNTQGRQVRQIPLSPPTAARHLHQHQQQQDIMLPPKHGTWSASHMQQMYAQCPPSSSPPVMMAMPVKQVLPPQPALPVAHSLPPVSTRMKPPPLDSGAVTGPHQYPHPHANGQPDDSYSPHSQHLPLTPQYCESIPLPPLIGQTGPAPSHQPQNQSTFHPQQHQQQQQQALTPSTTSSSSSSPPSYTAVSDGGSPKKSPSPVPQQAPVASTTAAPAPMAGPPAPPPPPGPPPPMAVPPPMPPPLPTGGGPPGGPPGVQPSGLAAALAGAKLRKVHRDESSPPGSGGKSDSNRSSGGSGGGGEGLMQEMNALLARRRKASEKPDEDDSSGRGAGQQNSTDAVKKPWERSNSADKSSLVSRVRPIGSTSESDTEFDRMKQEILDEVVRELHKVKDEIINAIRHEIGRISTS
uniref:Enah/Vasp-like a n=1 Tax=Nothobranchius kuhntae TaxID=321403 RepID=A0A1A8JEU8_NOTKU